MSSSGRWTKYQLKLVFNLYCQASGQTVPHLHIHLISRYRGDKEDPRGGVYAGYCRIRRNTGHDA